MMQVPDEAKTFVSERRPKREKSESYIRLRLLTGCVFARDSEIYQRAYPYVLF